MRNSVFLFSLLLFGLFFLPIDFSAQYRDPFSEKSSKTKIKKRNKKGLFAGFKKNPTKLKDPFRNIHNPKGLVGLNNDPFNSSGNMRQTPSGVDGDCFS